MHPNANTTLNSNLHIDSSTALTTLERKLVALEKELKAECQGLLEGPESIVENSRSNGRYSNLVDIVEDIQFTFGLYSIERLTSDDSIRDILQHLAHGKSTETLILEGFTAREIAAAAQIAIAAADHAAYAPQDTWTDDDQEDEEEAAA
jgi:hypothetical protein